MTTPIFPEVDPTTGALPSFTEARYLSATAGALKAPLASPTLTGTPVVPTATAGTNTTQIASTAFVQAALSALPADTVEEFQDLVAALLVAGTGVTLTYDDAGGTLTISTAGADAEFVRDTIGSALAAGTNVTVTVSDVGDTITIATTATVNSSDATLLDRANHTGVQTMSTVTDLETTTDSLQAQIDGLTTGRLQPVNWSTGGSGWGTYTTTTTVTRHFSSTNDVAATAPTFYSVHDKWFRHKDAP